MEDEFTRDGGMNHGFDKNYLPILVTTVLALGIGGFLGSQEGERQARREITQELERTLGEVPRGAISEVIQRTTYTQDSSLITRSNLMPRSILDKILSGEQLKEYDIQRMDADTLIIRYEDLLKKPMRSLPPSEGTI